MATGLKRYVFIPIPKKGKPKECSNYHTIALIPHTSKVMPKILRARQYVNRELPDVPAGASSSPVFLMMYSAYKLNKHGDNICPDVLLFLFGTSLLVHVQF